MPYRRTYTGTPAKRHQGPHMLVTEAQDLDQALDIIQHRQKQAKIHAKPHRVTKRALFAQAQGSANFRHVTLTDRVVSKRGQRKPRTPDVVWTREQVIEAYKTKMFKIGDLARRAKVSGLQIYVWVMGPDWVPVMWQCHTCEQAASDTSARPEGRQPHCRKCGRIWSANL